MVRSAEHRIPLNITLMMTMIMMLLMIMMMMTDVRTIHASTLNDRERGRETGATLTTRNKVYEMSNALIRLTEFPC